MVLFFVNKPNFKFLIMHLFFFVFGQHKGTCRFKPLKCPFGSCDKNGGMLLSANEEGACMTSFVLSKRLILSLRHSRKWSHKHFTAFDKVFMAVFLYQSDVLHHWLWCLGEPEESNSFLYEIIICVGNQR